MQVSAVSNGPAVGLVLVQGGVAKLPATKVWCAAAPDALIALGLRAGDLVLIGVTNQVNRSGPGTPGRSPASTFAPASVPSITAPGVLLASLHQRHAAAHRVDTAALPPRADASQGPSAGEFLVAAHVWPGSKLPRGVVVISQQLEELLAAPASGSVLALFSWPTHGASNAPDTLLSQLHKHTATVCTDLAIRLCYDVLRCRPAVVSTDTNTPASSTIRPRAADTPQSKGVGARGTPRSGAGASPATPGHATSTATQPPTTNTDNASTTLGDWALQLLSSTGAAVKSGSAGTHMSTNTGLGTAAAAALTAEQRQLLCMAAVGRLAGQTLLAGNIITLPLLGYTLVWYVEGLVGGIVGGNGHQLRTWGRVEVGTTNVELLLQGEVSTQEARFDHAADSVAGGSEVVSGPAGGARPVVELVRAARRAAEEDAGEGESAQAAADAAEQALRSGLAAAGVQYNMLGGVSHLVSQLREHITLPLRRPDLFAALRIRPPRGVLLHGPPGSGKTVLARAAAQDAGATLFVVNGPDIISEWLGESEARLKGVFAAARHLAPAIIFFDEIDAVAPARGGGAGDGGVASALSGGGGGGSASLSRLVTALLTAMDGANSAQQGAGFVVVGATNRPNALDPALRRPGRFERELEVGPAPPDGRRQILESRLRHTRHSLTPQDLTHLADAAHGFVAADLAALVNEASMSALRRAVRHTQHHDTASHTTDTSQSRDQQLSITWQDFEWARARVKPSALRDLAVEIPRVSWGDVGGLQDVKQKLQEAVVWPFQRPDVLARLGAVAPRGVLLYGPPGCSKTLLARAVAAEAKLNFLSIKGGELFSKYVGESEKAVSALFARARSTSPTIVFFDEIDALAVARADSNTGLADRVMAQLLSEMDGLQERVGVVVLAATNRPDCIDKALLRPGRFDRLIYVPPPDTTAREDILRIKLRNTPIASDVDLTMLATQCDGYSGADLGALVREAALCALDEDISTQQVSMHHFVAAKHLISPSAAPTPHMEAMYKQFAGS